MYTKRFIGAAAIIFILCAFFLLPPRVRAAETICPGCGEALTKSPSGYDTYVPAASCASSGRYIVRECGSCLLYYVFDADGAVIGSSENIEVAKAKATFQLAHDYGTEIPEQPATCTNAGVKAYYQCSRCEKLFLQDESGNYITANETDLQIEKKEHTFGAWQEEVAATCVSTGIRAHKDCTVCKKHFDSEGMELPSLVTSVKPAAHTFGAWQEEIPATCVAAGVKAHKDCAVCGRHFDASGMEITDLTISATGTAHSFGAWQEEIPATCTEAGQTAHKDCTHCGKHFDASGAEIADTLILPTGHSLGAWIEEQPAAYLVPGVKAHRDCANCGRHFDANGTELKNLTIPALKTGLSKSSVTLTLQKGKKNPTAKLTVLGETGGGVSYKSSNKKIATVDKKGKITGKKAGSCTITVTTKAGKSFSCKVKVQNKAPTSIKLSKKTVTLKKIGKTVKLKATLGPKTAFKETVLWRSSDTAVAKVDKNGKVKATGRGTCTITVYLKSNPAVKAECTVKVK